MFIGARALSGERGSADFMSIPVNTRGYDILFKQGSPIGSLNLQRIKLLRCKYMEYLLNEYSNICFIKIC